VKLAWCLPLLLYGACSYDTSGFDWSYDSGIADAAERLPDAAADAAPDARPDARPPPDAAIPCDASCVLAGGVCQGNVCTITCGGASLCPSRIVCPPGVSCDVTCEGEQECRGGIECSGPVCVVHCIGVSACEGGVDCQADACAIECSGDNACDKGVCCPAGTGGQNGTDCGNSCDNSNGACCQCGGC
jgi:hypothetical protein